MSDIERLEQSINSLTNKLDAVANGQLEMIVEFRHYRKEVEEVKTLSLKMDDRIRVIESKLPIYDDMKDDKKTITRALYSLVAGLIMLAIIGGVLVTKGS